MTLSEIQKELEKTWTLESYSDTFKGSTLPYRDFQHSMLHVMKATGKLVTMIEEADHKQEPSMNPFFPPQKAANYLADLIVCAIRMASKHPLGQIDIQKAVLDRIREKADVPKVS